MWVHHTTMRENYNPRLFRFGLFTFNSLATPPGKYCHRQTTEIEQLFFSSILPKDFSMQIVPIELVHCKILAPQSYSLVCNT